MHRFFSVVSTSLCLFTEKPICMQNKLYIWENSREKERRRLLVEEAEDKQHDGVWIDEKRGFLDKLVTR